MRKVLLISAAAFALLYGAAVVLALTGMHGWFGQPLDPLSGVFLLPLGLPWNQLPNHFLPVSPLVVAFAAPAVNLLLILAFVMRFGGQKY